SARPDTDRPAAPAPNPGGVDRLELCAPRTGRTAVVRPALRFHRRIHGGDGGGAREGTAPGAGVSLGRNLPRPQCRSGSGRDRSGGGRARRRGPALGSPSSPSSLADQPIRGTPGAGRPEPDPALAWT